MSLTAVKQKSRQINTIVRLDSTNHEYTKEGNFLIVRNVVVSKTGVYFYPSDDRYEAKLPDDLGNIESLKTLEACPVVSEHPSKNAVASLNLNGFQMLYERMIDSENATWYTKGFTIDKPVFENGELKISIKILDQELIEEIKNGTRSYISLGFICDFIPETGVFEGSKYTYKQVNIRYNHVAVVSNPRVGEATKIRLDSSDNVIYESNQKEKKNKMAIVNLGNFSVEVDDAHVSVANAFIKENKARIDSLETENKDLAKKTIDLETENKALKEKAVRLDSIERETFISKVEKVLGKGRVDSKATDKDLMIEAVKTKFPSFNGIGQSDDYLKSRFDSVIELMESEKQDDREGQKVGINVNALSGGKAPDSNKPNENAGVRLDSKSTGNPILDAQNKYIAKLRGEI